VNGTNITKNVAWYIIAQVSKFVPPGSVRIASNITGTLYNVAFRTPEGKKVLVVVNDASLGYNFNIKYKGNWATTLLPPGGVGTYTW
jgi:glucosylceramidase